MQQTVENEWEDLFQAEKFRECTQLCQARIVDASFKAKDLQRIDQVANFRDLNKLGVLASLSYLAGQYYRAAQILFQKSLGGETNSLFAPALFCFRHSVELRLKEMYARSGSMLGEEWDFHKFSHSIAQFADVVVDRLIRLGLANVEPTEPLRLLKELANLDPDSFGFRYPTDKKFGPATSVDFISMGKFYDAMFLLNWALENWSTNLYEAENHRLEN